MDFEQITYSKNGGTAQIMFRRPEVMNAITRKMLEEARQALDGAAKDDQVGVVVVAGEGRTFSAGVDLRVLDDRKLGEGSIGSVLDESARNFIEAIQSVPKAVIAKINGYCLTGALEIALACDLIIAAEDAKLGDTHAKWGLRPTWGMSQRLPRTAGILRAKELSFTADMFTGADAARWGIINRAVAADGLDEAVKTLAEKINENSRGSIAA